MGKIERARAIYRRGGLSALLDEIRRYVILHQLQPRVTNDGLYQSLGELQMRSPDRLRKYWHDPTDEYDDLDLQLRLNRTPFLFELLEPYVRQSDPILELGCGVGRNLNYLHECGYTDLSGVEINDEAIAILRREFPTLARDSTLYNESIEDTITRLPTNGFELTFTLSVLLVIHPEHEFVFDEMVRVTNGHIITIENEESYSHKQVARNYAEVFSERGCEAVRTVEGSEIAERTDMRPEYRAHVLRVDRSERD